MTPGTDKRDPRVTAVAIWLSMYVLYLMSTIYRSTNAVMAPEWRIEMNLTPDDLGNITAAFFFAFAVAQIPAGLSLDRFGPRWTIAGMMLLPVIGAIILSIAGTSGELGAAQAIMGAGCAIGLSGAIVVFARWFPPDRMATLIALFSGLGNVGILLSATPLAAAVQGFGWRDTFLGLAVLNVLLVLQLVLVVRDAPPGHPFHARRRETLGDILRGAGEVWREPAIRPILALTFCSLGIVLCIRGLWAGPYLADVHGLGTIERGNMLLLMTVAMLIGNVGFGPLDRIFDSRKRVVVAGAALTASSLLALALVPHPPLALAMGLLCALGLACNYVVTILAQGRALFPERLVGRAITLMNAVNFLGGTFLLLSSGHLIRAFPMVDAKTPEMAYRALFGALAAMVALMLVFYLRSRDVRPSAERRG